MDFKFLGELRQKYIENPSEGMTGKLVNGITDSDLLDMHYFLTEDDDFKDNEFEEGFYISKQFCLLFIPNFYRCCFFVALVRV